MSQVVETAVDASPIPPELLEEFYYDAKHVALAGMRDALAEATEQTGVTKTVVSQRLCKPKSIISRLFRGQTNPNLRTLSDIARAMGYRIEVRWIRLANLRRPNYQHELVAQDLPQSAFRAYVQPLSTSRPTARIANQEVRWPMTAPHTVWQG